MSSNSFQIESLKLENISFSYENNQPIFENMSFEFPMNQFVWVRAQQVGAGRSTLLQILAGLVPLQKGKYFINENDVNEMSFEEFLPWRLNIGYSFDFGGLLHNKTLFENLCLPLLYHKMTSVAEAAERVQYHMEKMAIWRYRDHRPSAVQGSVRKLACLIRPLLIYPQVLLLDDPSAGLTQELCLQYIDLIQEQRQKNQLKHIYISSLDEKLMSLIEHQEIFIDQGVLIHSVQNFEKKVVHL